MNNLDYIRACGIGGWMGQGVQVEIKCLSKDNSHPSLEWHGMDGNDVVINKVELNLQMKVLFS